MTLKTGDAVLVVEHDEATKTPRDGGKRYLARVVATKGIYIQVAYDDRAVNRGGLLDLFYKDSGWRAWDGALRWRLTTEEA